MTDDMKAPDATAAEATDGAASALSVDAERAAKAEADAADMKDRLLRTLAEMENLRRRTEKEVKDARDYAITGFARDLLSVADNLTRALAALPTEIRDSADEGLKALVDGVDMTGREMVKVLEKHGVKRLQPMGARFDPNVHQAMFEIPNPEVASGTVVQVLQDGFVIGERVLRPALVGVAKGGPKPQAQTAAEPGATVDRTA